MARESIVSDGRFQTVRPDRHASDFGVFSLLELRKVKLADCAGCSDRDLWAAGGMSMAEALSSLPRSSSWSGRLTITCDTRSSSASTTTARAGCPTRVDDTVTIGAVVRMALAPSCGAAPRVLMRLERIDRP
jgi:hypothetical protein